MKQSISDQHSTSCINLIFVNQPNLVIASVIYLLLHQNCHQQVIFCKLNLRIEFPQPYARKAWNYKNAQIDLINCAIDQFDWVILILNKNINKHVIIFNRTILTISHNFISKKILRDGRGFPWMNHMMKYLIKKKNC